MAYRFKTICPNKKCNAFLLVHETNDCFAGCKEREEGYCPRCGTEVYSKMTSGVINVYEITEAEYYDENYK